MATEPAGCGPEHGDKTLVVGIINNMPDSALESTERQFRSVLSDAYSQLPIRLRLFSLPERERSENGRLYVERFYEDIGSLWRTSLDGLIVTGAEPRTEHLCDERYWSTLARVVDWAGESTTAAIWSCLAAHAAVHHLDGIERRPFATKLSGLFECAKVGEHAIMRGIPARWRMPHSRQYDLSEPELISRGYHILSASRAAGADIFVKHVKSLFVFVQGHPEYEPDTLMREYRRDIRRFIAGERNEYPEIPRGYFDEETEARFERYRDSIGMGSKDIAAASSVPSPEGSLTFAWREVALRLYSNWLSFLCAQKNSNRGADKASTLSAPPAA
ncbi:MAG TPA: homoserine O-succinyltransferase [Candidatus Binataceae bacterium]|nr:homoserine O-succinyltransferase [Candidatus Binataceae bacterium]